jgi:hypothetical protein
MKLKNFTDFNAWAVEQWGDTELGDSRHQNRSVFRLSVQLLPLAFVEFAKMHTTDSTHLHKLALMPR